MFVCRLEVIQYGNKDIQIANHRAIFHLKIKQEEGSRATSLVVKQQNEDTILDQTHYEDEGTTIQQHGSRQEPIRRKAIIQQEQKAPKFKPGDWFLRKSQ
ncbi:hypothetical protein INT44_006117 [Umbelopsis vinacea]|uniref:Uncharacterized protein n=1 Tax=Umbelopsis vinacea TaxID=44442 RepID=A0A8H7PDI3_9FUNG|nr:hypothetical protein INT44_006117 [Umbelopsis vinacea]